MDFRAAMKRLSSILIHFGKSPRVMSCLVLAITAAVYFQTCFFEFLPFWDDDTNIHRNPLYSPLSLDNIALFWKGPFQQLYIPVTYSVWGALVALSRVLAGTSVAVGPINPVLFHGTNLLVHLASTALVFLILRRLILERFAKPAGKKSPKSFRPLSQEKVNYASAAGALLFAIHPVQVEVVAWVSGLRDLLGGAFSLAAIALFLFWLTHETRKPFSGAGVLLLATLSFLLAIGSKPGSVVTPAMALLCGAWILLPKKASLKPLWWLLPWFLIAALSVVLTSKAQPAAELARSLVPFWARPLVAGDAVGFYLWKLLWPFGLCADYGRSPNSLFDSGILFWSFLIPLFLAVLLCVKKTLRPFLIPYALLVFGVLPTLGLIPFNFQVVSTVSDRYLYLGMLGPAFAFTLFMCMVPSLIGAGAALILLPGWMLLTLFQLPEWAVGKTFFPATLSRNPTSWKSRHNYACTLDSQGKFQDALTEFSEAIRLRPSNAEAHNDVALTLLKMGRRQEAIQSFQHSLQVRPTSGAARNLASVLLMSGDPAQAVQVYRLAMQIDPGDLQNQRSLAWVLSTHPDSSVRSAGEAIALSQQIVTVTNAQVPLFLLTLSAALAEGGRFDEATAVAVRSAEVYQMSGDHKMGVMVQEQIVPALRNHQPIRDNPAALTP
jgi:tetratricopeptide (TPR) repeat protein